MNKNCTWEGKPKSKLVKSLMKKFGLTNVRLSKILGISACAVECKLQRDSFYFEDMLLIADVCGMKWSLIDSDGKVTYIDINDFPKAALNDDALEIKKMLGTDKDSKIREGYRRLLERIEQ